jgi:hypothetical protein
MLATQHIKSSSRGGYGEWIIHFPDLDKDSRVETLKITYITHQPIIIIIIIIYYYLRQSAYICRRESDHTYFTTAFLGKSVAQHTPPLPADLLRARSSLASRALRGLICFFFAFSCFEKKKFFPIDLMMDEREPVRGDVAISGNRSVLFGFPCHYYLY